MANYCYYTMKITGKPENIKEMYKIMKNDYDEGLHLHRVFNAYASDLITLEDGFIYVSGDCAWSVYSCMLEGEHTYYTQNKEACAKENKAFNGTTLTAESKRLNLGIEIYSEETGLEFEERYVIFNGEILLEDIRGMSEYGTEEYETVEEMNKELNSSFTKDEFESHDFLRVGGYEEILFVFDYKTKINSHIIYDRDIALQTNIDLYKDNMIEKHGEDLFREESKL